MAIFASTTLGANDPSRAMSIKALEARAQALAAAQAQQKPMESMPSPWQGVGQLTNTVADAFATRSADQKAAAQRAHLADIMSQVDPVAGPNPQQQAQIMIADPDYGRQLALQAYQAREAKAGRDFTASQTQEKAKLDEAAAVTQESRVQARPQTDAGKLKADLDAGRMSQEAYDAAMKRLTAPSAGEQKIINEQQSQNIDLQSAVDQLNEAHGLLQQGIRPGGLVGEATQGIGKAIPGVAGMVGVDPELTKRTDRFNQIMAGEALKIVNSMKGASSDKDLQFAVKTINDPATSPENKTQQLRVLLAKANAHLKASGQTLESMGGKPVQVEGSGAPAASGGSPEDAAALEWANANPNDPRAAKIKQRLGK